MVPLILRAAFSAQFVGKTQAWPRWKDLDRVAVERTCLWCNGKGRSVARHRTITGESWLREEEVQLHLHPIKIPFPALHYIIYIWARKAWRIA